MIDLRKFCEAESSTRPWRQKPWRKGPWVYATNGHVLLRVLPELVAEAVDSTSKQPNVESLFERHLDSRAGAVPFMPMPEVPKPKACAHCDGVGGHWSVVCPDCENGTFMHGDHEYDCKNCEESVAGPGWIDSSEDNPASAFRSCHECDGLGASIRANGNFYIGNVGYALVYAHMVSQLPGPVMFAPGDVATRSEFNNVRPGVFQFVGGTGILMPRTE